MKRKANRTTTNPASADRTPARKCRECGCCDEDCSRCIKRTGHPCWWIEFDLCSACA